MMDSFSYFRRAFSCAYIFPHSPDNTKMILAYGLVIINKTTKPPKVQYQQNALIFKESEMYFYLSRALLCISWKNMISIYEHLKGTLSSVCIRGTCHDDRTLAARRFERYVCYSLTYSTIIDAMLLVMLSLCTQNYLRRRISIQF